MLLSIRQIQNYLFFGISFAILAMPAFSQSSAEAGIEAYRNSKYDEATKILQSVTVTDKKDGLAWAYLGASLFKAGRAKDAVVALRKGKAKVEALVPGDDSPVSNFSKPRPYYTDMARQNLTTGVVRLAIELGQDGKVGFILPLETLPDGLTEQSIAAARSITFKPAVKNGALVSTVAIVEYTFEIR